MAATPGDHIINRLNSLTSRVFDIIDQSPLSMAGGGTITMDAIGRDLASITKEINNNGQLTQDGTLMSIHNELTQLLANKKIHEINNQTFFNQLNDVTQRMENQIKKLREAAPVNKNASLSKTPVTTTTTSRPPLSSTSSTTTRPPLSTTSKIPSSIPDAPPITSTSSTSRIPSATPPNTAREPSKTPASSASSSSSSSSSNPLAQLLKGKMTGYRAAQGLTDTSGFASMTQDLTATNYSARKSYLQQFGESFNKIKDQLSEYGSPSKPTYNDDTRRFITNVQELGKINDLQLLKQKINALIIPTLPTGPTTKDSREILERFAYIKPRVLAGVDATQKIIQDLANEIKTNEDKIPKESTGMYRETREISDAKHALRTLKTDQDNINRILQPPRVEYKATAKFTAPKASAATPPPKASAATPPPPKREGGNPPSSAPKR